MIRWHFLVVSLILASVRPVRAQDVPAPELCLAARESSAVSAAHGEKNYRFASEECRAQFLSDPERYAQLYDALLEMEAAGTPLVPQPASLVPS